MSESNHACLCVNARNVAGRVSAERPQAQRRRRAGAAAAERRLGAKAVGAAGVTAGAVRCSAWLGVAVIGPEIWKSGARKSSFVGQDKSDAPRNAAPQNRVRAPRSQ